MVRCCNGISRDFVLPIADVALQCLCCQSVRCLRHRQALRRPKFSQTIVCRTRATARSRAPKVGARCDTKLTCFSRCRGERWQQRTTPGQKTTLTLCRTLLLPFSSASRKARQFCVARCRGERWIEEETWIEDEERRHEVRAENARRVAEENEKIQRRFQEE